MEKKLSKETKVAPSDFDIEKYVGDYVKSDAPKTQEQTTKLVEPTKSTVPTDSSVPSEPDNNSASEKSAKKATSTKQRKTDLAEYQETFLKVPKISDRKNVFISHSTREMIVGIVRRFGGEKTSVSGFIESMVLHHFELYGDDFEVWKKL
jgi:hypothetical protein